jgi:hypothetical protein
MEVVQLYVLSPQQVLGLFAMGMVATGIVVILYATITGLCQSNEHKQRLMQIQDEKEQAKRELSQITQDYLQQRGK